MFYQPLLIFYRRPKAPAAAIRAELPAHCYRPGGSGTRFLALALLKANEIEPNGSTQLSDLEGEAARAALLQRRVDAIFLTEETRLRRSPYARCYIPTVSGCLDFSQANAYVRRFSYLSKLNVPAVRSILGENLPPADISLLAPTVEWLVPFQPAPRTVRSAHRSRNPGAWTCIGSAIRGAISQSVDSFISNQLRGGAVFQVRDRSFNLSLPAVLNWQAC